MKKINLNVKKNTFYKSDDNVYCVRVDDVLHVNTKYPLLNILPVENLNFRYKVGVDLVEITSNEFLEKYYECLHILTKDYFKLNIVDENCSDIGQLFDNNFDCYTNYDLPNEEPAISRTKFIKIFTEYGKKS